MTSRLLTVAVLGAWLPLGAALAEQAAPENLPERMDPQLQALVGECEACHGPGGVSDQDDVPSLAGQSETYLRELLDQFYYYERHCPTTTYRHSDRPKTPLNMCNVANTLSEDDKQALARYFSNMALP